jgi:hypothetical protein
MGENYEAAISAVLPLFYMMKGSILALEPVQCLKMLGQTLLPTEHGRGSVGEA